MDRRAKPCRRSLSIVDRRYDFMSRSTLKDRSAEHVVTGTQTFNSSAAIYPIVCLLLYCIQARHWHCTNQRPLSLWLRYFISAILNCLIGLLSVSRGLVSVTLRWQRVATTAFEGRGSDAADAIKDAFGMRVNCLWTVIGLCLSHAVKPSYRGWRTTTSSSRHHTSSSVYVVPKPKLPIDTP